MTLRSSCLVAGLLTGLVSFAGALLAGEATEKTQGKPPEEKSDAPAGKDSGKTPDKAKKPVPGPEDWAKRLARGRKQLKGDLPWAAEKTLRQCLEEAKAFAEDDPRKADAYLAMGDLEIYQSQHERALPLYGEARRLLEGRLGKDSIEVLPAILGQAEANKVMVHVPEAELVYLEAVALAERAKDTTPQMVDWAKYSLEEFLGWSCQFARAEEMCRARLKKYLENPKTEPWIPLFARTTLLGLILAQKRLEEGHVLAKQIVEEAKTLAGSDGRRVAQVYDTIGKAFARCKDFKKAAEHFRGSLSIWEKDPKKYSGELGYTLLDLGNALRKSQENEEAEQVFSRALKLWESERAPPRMIESLNGLAEVYSNNKKLDKAIATMRRALQLREKYYGKSRLAVIETTQLLVTYLVRAKQYAEAETLYRQMLETHEQFMGSHAMDAALDRFWLAYVVARQGRAEEALPQYEKAISTLMDARLDFLPQIAPHSRQVWNDSQDWCWSDFFTFCTEEQAKLPHVTDVAVDAALRYQGSLLAMGTASRKALFASGDPKLKEIADKIGALQTQIAYAYQNREQNPDSLRAFQEAKASLRALEDELTRACAPYARQRKLREGEPAEIRKAIPADAALVTVLRLVYVDRDPEKKSMPHYLAFVLGAGGESAFVDLGPALVIDESLAHLSSLLTDASGRLAQGGAPSKETAHREVARKLSELVLAPLFEHLKGKPRWLFCLDGPIATLNVALLPEPGGDALVVERSEVSYLTRASEILEFAPTKLDSADLRILADPDFDAKVAAGEHATMRGGAFAGLKWARLPGTRKEAEALAALFRAKHLKVDMRTGADATREALFAGPVPRFLHVATHGFSLPEKFAAADVGNMRGLAGIVAEGDIKSTVTKVANLLVCKDCGRIHAKGLRTGLVLAGAGSESGGVVLAEELQALNLFGTEMVVLSACESGLGDIAAGEGVQGLRSAFLESGARSLVTSLWKVPDRETKDLMCAFYRHVVAGERKSKALQQAMLELRTAQRKDMGGSHPFYWAGFILVGNSD